MLGGDDALMDKACATILGERERRDEFEFGELKPRNALVCGCQVTVLKTPFQWLEHLKSYFFFKSRVQSMKNDLQFFESQMYPGPHAFLLVLGDVEKSGKENYLFYALSEVFGKEALDYCMVLFTDEARHNIQKNNYCLKMCGGRFHILMNSDNSVRELFTKTDTMTQRKNHFFTNNLECFRKAEYYFQEEFNAKYEKLRRELKEDITEDLTQEINDMKEEHAKEVRELNDNIKHFKANEDQLNKELEDCREREKLMRDQFCTEERLLREELSTCEKRASGLKDDKDTLQKQVEKLKHYEKQWQEIKVQEKELREREKELHKREKKVVDREKELEVRERKWTHRDAESSERPQTTAQTLSACKYYYFVFVCYLTQ